MATRNQDGAQRRNRIKISCEECRRLKLRCERPGVWPSKAQLDVVKLAKRLEELEGVLKDAGIGHRIPPPLELDFRVGKGPAEDERSAGEDDGPARPPDGGGVEGLPVAAAIGDPLEGLMDGVGSLSIRDEDGRTRFLGTSAGSAYFAAGDEDSSEDEAEDEFTAPPDGVTLYPFIQLGTAYPKAQELERLRRFLPPRAEAERLSKCYWTYLSFMFEPLEESVYYEDYLPKAYTNHDLNGTMLACVFIILSLGSLFDPSVPSTPNATAAHYFVVCQNALTCSRFLSNNTMAGAQTLQLMANYLFCQHNLQEGGESFFPILGAALRMLQTMGLHRDGTKWGLSGPELDRRRLVFYELMTLERMQAFISGRPYLMNPNHFDTQMPSNAEPYQIWKWKLGIFLGRVIDEGFSIKIPTYGTIQMLDQELRDIFAASPKSLRCGALPDSAFIVRPTGAPSLQPTPPNEPNLGDLKQKQRQHTLEMVFAQIFFYLHKPAFARALTQYPDEPLASPWAASVAAVSLETGVYMLAIARSWVALHPIVNPRWWHIFFHAFAASVAQSSLVIKSPGSMLARHAWGQLNLAVEIFESASVGGAPVSMFVPRLRTLRDTCYTSLQASLSIPSTLGAPSLSSVLDVRTETTGTDADLSVLGPTTRLDRKPKRSAMPGQSDTSSASHDSSSSYKMKGQDHAYPLPPSVGYDGNHLEDLGAASRMLSPSANAEYSPFDSPIGQLISAGSVASNWPTSASPLFAPLASPSSTAGGSSDRRTSSFGTASTSQASLQHELTLQQSFATSYPPSNAASPHSASRSPTPFTLPQYPPQQQQPPQPTQYRQPQPSTSRQTAPSFPTTLPRHQSSSSQHGVDPFSAPFGGTAFPPWETWNAQGASVAGEQIDMTSPPPLGASAPEGDQWMWYNLAGNDP
ncbi:hypothetical protein RQP46_002632 [Phenoliferia psychrophenolica]